MSMTLPPPVAFATSASTRPTVLPERRFGRTEERVPILGLGTAPAGFALPDEEAVALFHAALDRGITYFDTAPGYERAQVQLGQMLPARRHEVFLATKCWTAKRDEALQIHEQNLRDLQTDHVDLLYAHCVGNFEPEEMLAPDGVFAGLVEAQRRGWTRHIGFTAHNNLPRVEAVLKGLAEQGVEISAVMLAMNYADRHTYNFEGRLLPRAGELDLGVAAMKVYGGAKGMDYKNERVSQLGERDHHQAFRYALGLPGVATAVIGMFTVAEIEQNVAWAQEWEALTPEDGERLNEEGRGVAAEWGAHFGEVE
jgi:predicted aldo/keto reductase-like oxidoreductase